MSDEGVKALSYSSTFARGAAILAVIAIHVTAGQLGAHDEGLDFHMALLIVINSLGRFAAPLFFILTAFGLGLRGLPPSAERFNSRHLKTILIPYFGYSILYQLLFTFALKRSFHPGDALLGLLIGTTAAHFWFIYSLGILVLFHRWLFGYYRLKLAGSFWTLALLGLAQISWNVTITFLLDPSFGKPSTLLIALDHELLKHWWFFFAGYWLADNADEVLRFVQKRRMALGVLGFYLIVAAVQAWWWMRGLTRFGSLSLTPFGYTVMYAAEPFAGAAAVLLLRCFWGRAPQRLSAICSAVGLYSYGIYYFHPIIIAVLRESLMKFGGIGFESKVYFPIVFIGAVAITFAGIKLASRIRLVRIFT